MYRIQNSQIISFSYLYITVTSQITILVVHVSNSHVQRKMFQYKNNNNKFIWQHLPKASLSPIYTMKNRCDMRCDRFCNRGNPCCRLSQAVATAHRKKWARFNFCDSMHCNMGRDMHCDRGNPYRKLGVGWSCVFSTSCTGLATK